MEDTTRMTDAVDLGHKLGYVLLATADASGFPNLAVANVIKRVSEDKLAISSWFCPASCKLKAQSPPGRHRLGQRYRPGISDTGHSGTGG